jgi:putative ABC transport system ATP-binding protein
MPIVAELRGVVKRYRRGDEVVHALRGVTFELAAGEMVALVGPSGCGKSTTLNLLAGIDRPDEGEVIVCGVDLAIAREPELVRSRRRHTAIVFQAFHLMPHLTVEENIALPLALDGTRDPERVRQLVRRVGLEHRRSHFPGELSGGEQQRTAVARALVRRPAVVLADEPTGSLDSGSGAAVLALMDDLRREEGSAMLLATHDETIAHAADRVILMRDGAIEAVRR